MKKITILFLLIGMLLPLEALAQKERPFNHIGISLEGGGSHLFLGSNLSPVGFTKPGWGFGGGGALYYELQYKHFIFHTGFGVDYSVNNSRFNAPDYMASVVEYPGMKYHYTFNNYSETTRYGVGYVPVMFGGNFDKMFFLVGAKLGVISFGGSTHPKADVSIWATDDDIIDPLEDVYTHQMTDYAFSGTKTPMAFNNLNIMGSFEIGLNLDCKVWKAQKDEDSKDLKKKKGAKKKAKKKQPFNKGAYYKQLREKKPFKDCLHYRISLFADYGFSNILPSNLPAGDLVQFNGVSDMTPLSVYNYTPHQNAVLNNLLVGVKVAIQYEIPPKAPKKGDMATPYIVTFVSDERTGKPLSGTSVTTQAVTTNSKKPKKAIVKTTDSKYGRVAKAYPPGDYMISASHAGYFPQEPFLFRHEDRYDTLQLALYPQQTLRSNTVDAKTGRPVAAYVTIFDEKGDTILKTQLDSLSNHLSVPIDDRKQYTACASAEGYLDTCMLITDWKEYTIELEPQVVFKFLLKNMFFATDKTSILSSSKPALQELYDMLNENPDIRIRIIGHTDDVGNDAYNLRLSEGRAASVKKEMVKRGIDPERIETEGHGEIDPIVPNDSNEHRQMNRRVEIEILNNTTK